MSWHEQVQAGLPSPRDGEPSELRRDIADELADHLTCALQRERKRTDDESTAYKSVIRRFGDPIRIANRLWLDAMKETIMNQRIGLVTNVVLAIACIAIAVVAFSSLKQNTALSNALLTKLESIGAGAETNNSVPDWAEATIPILAADMPAVDYRVMLSGEAFNPGKVVSLKHRSDDDGGVAFGPIRPGRYSLRVEDPSGLQLTTSVILYPGHNKLDPVSMPALNPQPATVSFALNLPEQIKDHVAFVRLVFDMQLPEILTADARREWPSLDVLLRPDGTVARSRNGPVVSARAPIRRTGTERYIDPEALEQRRTVELDGALTYELEGIVAYVPVQDSVDRYVEISYPLRQPRRPGQADAQNIKRNYFGGLPPFRASSAQENAWPVEIPDWLFQAVFKHIADSDRATSAGGPKPRPNSE